MAKSLDFSDLGATEVASPAMDFGDLGAEKVGGKQGPEISKLDSALAGAQQGTTLGFGDEIQGAIPAGLDKVQELLNKLGIANPSPTQINAQMASQGVTGDTGPASTLAMYQQMRDQARQKNEAAQAANPMSYMGGNIAGGALTAAVAPQALVNPMGSAPAAAPLLQKIATGAINAAPMGAAIGAGASNADLTQGQIGPAVVDTAKDMGAGMAIGGALPLIAEPIKATGKAIKNSKSVQDLLDSYKAGLAKTDLHSPEFLKNSRDQLKSLASQADDAVRTRVQQIFGDKKKLLTSLDDAGHIVDTQDAIQGAANAEGTSTLLKPDERQILKSTIANTMKSGYVTTPSQLESRIQDFKALRGSVESNEGRRIVDEAVRKMQAQQNALSPEVQNMNNQLFQTIDSGEALTGKNPLDYLTGKQDMGLENTLANKLQKINNPNVKSDLDDILNKGLQSSKNAKISPLKELVPDAADAVNMAPGIARNMELANSVQNPKMDGSSIINTIRGTATGLGNSAGQTVSANKEFLQQGVSKLSDMTGPQATAIAQKMSNGLGKAAAAFGRSLMDAQGKNNVAKSAAMNSLMQQPEFRALYHKVTGEQNGDESGK